MTTSQGSYDQISGAGVAVQLSTGKSEHADLLIGADGSHSRVRHLMLGDSELAFRFLGFHTAAFVFEDRSFAESLEGKRYDCAGQVRLRRWTFGRVALVGDACQCTSPLAGQGASLAMHGAYVLADELVRAKSLDDALARYERAVKPQAERKQSMGRRVAPWLVPATGWRLSMRNVLIRLANARSTGWMLRPMLASG